MDRPYHAEIQGKATLGKATPRVRDPDGAKIFVDGSPVETDKKILKENCPHIVVGTPGRILDLVSSKSLPTTRYRLWNGEVPTVSPEHCSKLTQHARCREGLTANAGNRDCYWPI